MSVPMVSSCCCCDLHTGTLIIGCLYTVWALLELIGYCLMVTLWPLGDEGQVSIHKYAFYISAAVVSGTHMLVSILLVVAAIKKLPSLTLPWTMVTGIITAIYFVICLTGISLILQDTGETLALEIIVICVCLARTCISVYCIIVVHSQHKNLMIQERERAVQNTQQKYKEIPMEEIPLSSQRPHERS